MGGFDGKKGYDHQDIFALLKVLELYQSGANQSIRVESPNISPKAIEVADIYILNENAEFTKEIWQCKKNSQTLKQHATILHKIKEIYPNHKTLCGSIQFRELDSSSKKLQNYFLFKKKNHWPEMFEHLQKEFFEMDGLIEALLIISGIDEQTVHLKNKSPKDDITYKRYALEGFSIQTMMYKIKESSENIFKKSLASGEPIEEVFPNLTGVALERLKNRKGDFISFDQLIEDLKNQIEQRIIYSSTFNTHSESIQQILHQNKERVKIAFQNTNSTIEQLFIQPNIIHSISDKEISITCKINNYFHKLLEKENFTLIYGNFGEGKSTLVQYLCYHFSNLWKNGNPIPVYIPLRTCMRTRHIKDAVTNALNPIQFDNMFWEQNEWILFCDGFDELNIQHQYEPDKIIDLFAELTDASQRKNLKVVLTSRPILFLDPEARADTVNLIGHHMTLLPFEETQIKEWLNKWNQNNPRITWEMLTERHLTEVVKTPVILFLVAKIFQDELLDKNEKLCRAEIYRTFFDWTAKTGGYVQEGDKSKHKVLKHYRKILQEIAWIIFTHPESQSGMLHYEIILAELKRNGLFDSHSKSIVQDTHIFIAHAFKEGAPDHIEFMHQSLREYLVAEKIFETFQGRTPLQINKHLSDGSLITDQPLTPAKIDFLRELVSLKKIDEIDIATDNDWDWQILLVRMKESKQLKNIFSNNFYKMDQRLLKVGVTKEIDKNPAKKIGNLVTISFLYSFFMQSKYSDTFNTLGADLKYFISFIQSNAHLRISLEPIIGSSLFSNLHLNKFSISSFEFKNYEIKKCFFTNPKITDTRFDLSVFNEVDFCVIDEVEHSPPEDSSKHKNMEYGFFNCEFNNVYFDCTLSHVVFQNCIFICTDFIEVKNVYATYVNCHFKHSVMYVESCAYAKYVNCIFEETRFLFKYKPTSQQLSSITFDHCTSIQSHKPFSLDGSHSKLWKKIDIP